VIATRGVKIRPPAYGPDFVKATRLGRRPRVQHRPQKTYVPCGATPHGTYITRASDYLWRSAWGLVYPSEEAYSYFWVSEPLS